ncbi:tetratricopeptide repeat protein [Streptomyces sp. BE147]|uniref:tetratricopeptide repeat protein n=1 Tax=Streptomyces sp. BE147 TaxID=3002524 RepID=UPI002E78AC10|nr:tetratricopeptide repeat protein [Streptomyces sp. BE147]MEE1738926.1 tetratricopeptide repeat protein [Streptomyces sp. BE147]
MSAELESLADDLMRVMAGGEWKRFRSDAKRVPGNVLGNFVVRLGRIKNVLLDGDPDSVGTAWSMVFREVLDLNRRFPSALSVLRETLLAFPAGPDDAVPLREDAVRRSSPDGTSDGPAVATGAIHQVRATGDSTPSGGHRSDFRDGAFTGPVQGNGVQNNNYFGPHAYHATPPVTEWQQLGRADPVALGVRRSRRLPEEPVLPVYTGRDCDTRLGALVREAARSGGLVLVTGEPLSGKTRTAWAALFSNLSGTTRIYAPPHGTDLRGLPAVLRERHGENAVLWLDDLEGHLGENGLSAAVLADLVARGTPVIATMGDEAYDTHRFGTPASARVLIGVEPVELSREWSLDEMSRLVENMSDRRLVGAYYAGNDRGVTEYLAIGPELADEWRRARRANAHPRGHLLVRAAIDLARCGAGDDLALDVLRRAHRLYGAEYVRAERESLVDALAWASGVRHGVTGMLVAGRGRNTWRVYHSLVADAHDQAPGFDSPVPLEMWPLALEVVRGVSMLRDDIHRRAHAALEPDADGDPDVLMVLGRIDREYGDEAASERWFRDAADAGSTEAAALVGKALAARDEAVEAIPYLEAAAEAGDTEAQRELGSVLAERAEFWLTEAAEAGDGPAAQRLGDLHRGQGHTGSAMQWYLKAAACGQEANVAWQVGSLLHDWEQPEEAEKWYGKAVAQGDARAMNNLALIRDEAGAKEEAERLYRQAAEAGNSSAACNVGHLLQGRGKTEEARHWFELSHGMDDYNAAYALAVMLEDEGNEAEAEEWFGKAVEAGHHCAEQALADLRAAREEGPDNVEG